MQQLRVDLDNLPPVGLDHADPIHRGKLPKGCIPGGFFADAVRAGLQDVAC